MTLLTTPDAGQLIRIVEDACTAPSFHNTQPWSWVALPDCLELHADWSRHLTHADTDGRDLVVSCGAALHTATVAAAALGWAATAARIPDPSRPTLLATLTFRAAKPSAHTLGLAHAIHRRHTDRREVSSWPVPIQLVDELTGLAGQLGVLVSSLDSWGVGRVQELLVEARDVQNADDAYLRELGAWTNSASDEGIPATNLLAPDSAGTGASVSRFPTGSLREYDGDPAADPTWLVLSTSSDDPTSWLRTGEALAAMWLSCTVDGLSLVPFSQLIEVAATRRVLQSELLGDMTCPQVVVRLGWPPIQRLPVGPTARRPVDAILVFGDGGRTADAVATGAEA